MYSTMHSEFNIYLKTQWLLYVPRALILENSAFFLLSVFMGLVGLSEWADYFCKLCYLICFCSWHSVFAVRLDISLDEPVFQKPIFIFPEDIFL